MKSAINLLITLGALVLAIYGMYHGAPLGRPQGRPGVGQGHRSDGGPKALPPVHEAHRRLGRTAVRSIRHTPTPAVPQGTHGVLLYKKGILSS